MNDIETRDVQCSGEGGGISRAVRPPTFSILTKALVYYWDSKHFVAVLEKVARYNKSKIVSCLISEIIVYFRKSDSRQ